MEVVIFIGLQGSGKSTFYRERFADTHALVSKDLYPSARNRQKRQMRELMTALEAGRSVVIDNTNPTAADRESLIRLAREYRANVVGFYFESKTRDCLERNRSREGAARVPDVAIYATAANMKLPSLREGFDTLHYVRIREGGGFQVLDWVEEADES
jgi:predicted kinase